MVHRITVPGKAAAANIILLRTTVATLPRAGLLFGAAPSLLFFLYCTAYNSFTAAVFFLLIIVHTLPRPACSSSHLLVKDAPKRGRTRWRRRL
jgi:hypothetical protein